MANCFCNDCHVGLAQALVCIARVGIAPHVEPSPSDSAQCQNDKQERGNRGGQKCLAALTKGDFEGAYGFSVADAFELAVELGGGIVWVALVVVVGRFGLTLFESVDEIGLSDGLETENHNADRGGGGVKAEMLFSATLSVFIARSLQQEHKSEERKSGQESAEKQQFEVHGRPFVVMNHRRGSARRLWLRRCF